MAETEFTDIEKLVLVKLFNHRGNLMCSLSSRYSANYVVKLTEMDPVLILVDNVLGERERARWW